MPTLKATFDESVDLGALFKETTDLQSVFRDDVVIGGGAAIYRDTVEGWNSRPQTIAKKDAIYVYTDYQEFEGENIPGFKIGDGLAYLIDIPFVAGNKIQWEAHINDTSIHVTQQEKDFWNNKVRAIIGEDGTLVFTVN